MRATHAASSSRAACADGGGAPSDTMFTTQPARSGKLAVDTGSTSFYHVADTHRKHCFARRPASLPVDRAFESEDRAFESE